MVDPFDTSTRGDFDFKAAADAADDKRDRQSAFRDGGAARQRRVEEGGAGRRSDAARAQSKEPMREELMSDARKAQLLEQHNCHRKRFGLNPLRWDDELARAAQAYAEKCNFEHAKDRGRGIGENLARTTRNADASGWIAEEPLFPCGSTFQVAGGKVPPYGHWTQMVWPSTTALGCGVAKCGNTEILVCRYKPTGNWRGEAPLSAAQCQAARESTLQCPFQQGAPPPALPTTAQGGNGGARGSRADQRRGRGRAPSDEGAAMEQAEAIEKQTSNLDGLTAEERSTILDMHNRARAEVGAPPLIWDAALTRAAAEYAAMCDEPFQHWSTSGKPRPCFRYDPSNPAAPVGAEARRITGRQAGSLACMPMGENLYHGQCADPVRTAVKLWYDEIACSVCGTYQGEEGSCVPQASGQQVCGKQKCAMCGHYTQMVWKTSRRIGCAKKKCPSGRDYLVCEYFPGGNVGNHLPFDCSYCEGVRDKFHGVVECRAHLPVGDPYASTGQEQRSAGGGVGTEGAGGAGGAGGEEGGGEDVRRLFPTTRGRRTEAPAAPTPVPRTPVASALQPAAPSLPPVADGERAAQATQQGEDKEDEKKVEIVPTDPGVLLTPSADEDDGGAPPPAEVEEPPRIVPAAAPSVVSAPSAEEVEQAKRAQRAARTEAERARTERAQKEQEASSLEKAVQEAKQEEDKAKAAAEQALAREQKVSKLRGDSQLLIRLQRERSEADYRQSQARARREEAEQAAEALRESTNALKEKEEAAQRRLREAEERVDALVDQTRAAAREQTQVDANRAAAERAAERSSPRRAGGAAKEGGWIIALGVAGALVLVALVALGAFMLYRDRNRRRGSYYSPPGQGVQAFSAQSPRPFPTRRAQQQQQQQQQQQTTQPFAAQPVQQAAQQAAPPPPFPPPQWTAASPESTMMPAAALQ